MDELRRLWREHEDAPYPDGYRGVEVAGVELVMLDADIAGLVSQCLGGARLDPEGTAILKSCYGDVVAVTRELKGPAGAYFERLRRMAAIVLEATDGQRAV